MTTTINNRPAGIPALTRTQSDVTLGASSKPELKRSNSSPAALGSGKAAEVNRPPLTRTTSAPLPGTTAKPELTRSNSAPGALPASTEHLKDKMEVKTPTAAPVAPKQGWYGKSADTATSNIMNGATGVVGKVLGGATLLNNIATLPGKYREAIKAAQSGDFNAAVQQGSIAARGTLATVKGGLELSATVREGMKFSGVADEAVKAIGATGDVAKAIATKAAATAFAGKELRNVDVLAELAKSSGKGAWLGNTIKMAGADALRNFGLEKAAAGIEKGVAAAGQKVASEGGEALLKGLAHGDDAAKAALGAAKVTDTALDAAKVVDTSLDIAKAAGSAAGLASKGAGTLAKAAGRFAPGANVAFAALDTAIAVSTFRDPNASVAAKVTSGITALGSIVAATNIPVVSQVGAAVSVASTVAGVVADKFGGAIVDGAKAVGGAIADGAKAVGEGVKNFFKGW